MSEPEATEAAANTGGGSNTDTEHAEPTGFGMFAGVFTPTLLTILGVIMYLRQGYVIGEVGLLGAFVIIVLAFGITACTGLSLASLTTNIRIGAGGAYSIISQSLGIEMGGSIGVPLFLSQVLATTMYIFGFREGWLWIFPDHPAILVDLGLFAVLAAITLISTKLAFKIQYVIMAIIGASLVSIAIAAFQGSMQYEPQLWGPTESVGVIAEGNFWIVFAVFFPAATGIMAGANMSGELKDPRRAIPLGTMAAIAVSFVIYMVLAYWLAASVSPEELRTNYTVMIDKAFWGPAVLAGLLGATFSSALASLIGAPRILQALGEHRIVPRGDWVAKKSSKGEPQRAMWVSGALVLLALMLRDLNVVAPFITMFFLITYGMLNIVVLVEDSLGLISFRPLLRVPRVVPFLGAAGCIFAMFIINPIVGLVAVGVVLVFYGLLIRRHLDSPFSDVRSGLFIAIAQWAAQKASELPAGQARAWKPNVLVPVDDALALRGNFEIIRDLAKPTGYVEIMGIVPADRAQAMEQPLTEIADEFRRQEVFSRWEVIEADSYAEGLMHGIEALSHSFFAPNVLLLTVDPEAEKDLASDAREEDMARIMQKARDNGLGVVLAARHPKTGLGTGRMVNLWIHDRAPDFELALQRSNLDLAILAAYTIALSWEAEIRLVTVIKDESEEERAHKTLENLIDLARLPRASIEILHGDGVEDGLGQAPRADLNIFGRDGEPDFDFLRQAVKETESSCLFVRDSGKESAIA